MGVDFDPYLKRVVDSIRQNWYTLIPEEARPSRELRRLSALLKRAAPAADGFRRACVQPLLNALVAGAGHARPRLPEPVGAARRALCYAALEDGPGSLSAADRNLLLSDPEALSRLHHLLWTQPVAHAGWKVMEAAGGAAEQPLRG